MSGLLLAVAIVFALYSCNKSDDQQLRGKWQLRTVLETDSIGENETVSQIDTIFYNFDNHIFFLQTGGGLMGYYEMRNDSICIEIVDDVYKDPNYLNMFGWNSPRRNFRIEELTNNRLRLKETNRELVFRKF